MSRHLTPIQPTQCEAHCFGPEGPGGALQRTMDKWRGALALGVWVAGISLGLLAAAISVSIALAPGIVRSSVAEVTPGVVREELRKAGIAAIAEAKRKSVMAEVPTVPWLINQAHADERQDP